MNWPVDFDQYDDVCRVYRKWVRSLRAKACRAGLSDVVEAVDGVPEFDSALGCYANLRFIKPVLDGHADILSKFIRKAAVWESILVHAKRKEPYSMNGVVDVLMNSGMEFSEALDVMVGK